MATSISTSHMIIQPDADDQRFAAELRQELNRLVATNQRLEPMLNLLKVIVDELDQGHAVTLIPATVKPLVSHPMHELARLDQELGLGYE